MTDKSFTMIVPVLLLLVVLPALAGCTGSSAGPGSTSTIVPAVPAGNITKAEMKTLPVGAE